MAERVDPNSTQEVEIALAPGIPQIDASPALEKHALAVVSRQQQLGFGKNHGSQAHATVTSVPP